MYFRIFVLSAVVMGISQVIAKERVFAWLRDWLGGRATYLGYLVSCPYCVSHWVSFVLVPLTGTYVIDILPQWGVLSLVARWFLSSIFVTVMAAFMRIGFYLVDEGQGLLRREIVKAEAESRIAQQEVHELVGDEPPPRLSTH